MVSNADQISNEPVGRLGIHVELMCIKGTITNAVLCTICRKSIYGRFSTVEMVTGK